MDDKANAHARQLAVHLREKHFPEPQLWEPLPDTVGLLTQIDNMVAALPPLAEIDRLRAVNAKLVEALEHAVTLMTWNDDSGSDIRLIDPQCDKCKSALAALAEAKP